MSQIATARALPRVAGPRSKAAPPRDLRVVVGAPKGQAGLVALSLTLLTAGLVAVLLLNTWMAQGAFVLTGLEKKSSELSDTEQALRHDIDAQSAPSELARRALDQGMVPATTAAFLRLGDGTILGVAEPATADSGFTVVARAKPATPSTPTTKTASAAPAPAADPASSAAAANLPQPGTTVTTEGTVTRTTVIAVTADHVETTVTSVDSASGATTSTTTRTPMATAATPPTP